MTDAGYLVPTDGDFERLRSEEDVAYRTPIPEDKRDGLSRLGG